MCIGTSGCFVRLARLPDGRIPENLFSLSLQNCLHFMREKDDDDFVLSFCRRLIRILPDILRTSV
jgi:hypothetical protein